MAHIFFIFLQNATLRSFCIWEKKVTTNMIYMSIVSSIFFSCLQNFFMHLVMSCFYTLDLQSTIKCFSTYRIFWRASVATRQVASGFCLLATLLIRYLCNFACNEHLNGESHIWTTAQAGSCCKEKACDKLEILPFLLPSGLISVD